MGHYYLHYMYHKSQEEIHSNSNLE